MKATFNLPLPPSLNSIINASRRSRSSANHQKQFWTDKAAAICQDLPKFESQVWLEFHWQVKNPRRDPDNIASAAKFIMDGMLKAKMIIEDNLLIIQSPVIHHYAIGTTDEVTIIIRDTPT